MASRPYPDKCKVCGEKAKGHHYQIISCKGCKSFFRRAIVLGRRYSCKKEGNCVNETLRRCKACRFQMCINAGMQQNMVIPQNEAEASNIRAGTLTVSQPVRTFEDRAQSAITELMQVEKAFERLRFSSFDPHPITECNENIIMEGPSKLGIHFEALPSCSSALRIPDLESMKQFLKHLYHTKWCGAPGSVKQWTTTNLVCAAELTKTIPNVGKMMRTEKFRFLLQSSLPVSHFSDAFFSYQQSSIYTVYPDGTMPYAGDPPTELARELNMDIIKRIREIGMDQTEFILARVILALSLGDSQSEREFYSSTLCSYVIARRGTTQGPVIFLQIISLINYVIVLTQRYKDFHSLGAMNRRRMIQSPLLEAALRS